MIRNGLFVIWLLTIVDMCHKIALINENERPGMQRKNGGLRPLDFDSPTLQDFRRYGIRMGNHLTTERSFLVQDEMAEGSNPPYITRKLLNHRKSFVRQRRIQDVIVLNRNGDPSLRSGRDSFSRLLALAQFL